MFKELLSTLEGLTSSEHEFCRYKDKIADINLKRVRSFAVILAFANLFLVALPNLIVYLTVEEKQTQSSLSFLLLQLSLSIFMGLFYAAARRLPLKSKPHYKIRTTNLFVFIVLLHAFGLSVSAYDPASGVSIFLLTSCACMVGLYWHPKKLLLFIGGANVLYLLSTYLIFGHASILHSHLFLHLLFGGIFFLLARSVNKLRMHGLSNLEKIDLQSAELRSSNQILRMTEHTLSSINQNMHQGIFRLEKERGFTYTNDCFARLLGYQSATELVSDPTPVFITPADLDQISRRVNEQGFIEGMELEIERKDKEKFWAQISCSVRRDENSGTLVYEGSATDISHKRRALQQALDNAAKLEQAEKIAHAGFYEINISNGEITYSAGLSDILETSAQHSRNLKQHLAFVHPEDQTRVRQTLLEGISRNKEFTLEYRIISKSGKLRYLNSQAGLIRDEKGNKIKILGTVQDVTTIRQSQQALEYSEAYLKAAFHNDRYGIYLVDMQFKLIDFNQESSRNLKLWRDIDLRKGMDVRDTFLPQTQQLLEPLLLEGMQGKSRLLDFKVMENTPQETWLELYISPVKDSREKVLGVLMMASNITERKESEKLLANLSLVASNTDNAVVISDSKYRIEWVNEAFTQTTGFKKEDVTNRFPKEFLLSERTDSPTLTLLNNCLREGKSFSDELLIRDKNKQDLWVHLTINPVFNADGLLTKFVSVCTNLNKLKAYEQQLQIAKEKAERSAESKEDFFSSVSHELRTPLNAVIGLTHHLLQNKPREDQQEDLSILKFSAENLLSLINDILDLSKIEAGKVRIEKTAFNLKEIVHSLKQSFQGQAESKGLGFRVSIHEQVPQALFGDSVRLIQILANLLSNAVKFTSKGMVHMQLNAEVQESGCCLLLVTVEDTGKGIAADKLGLIFDKFEQANDNGQGNFGGTGLGLLITRQLVELQGGRISVDSQAGEGSVFSLSIPYQLAQAQELPTVKPVPSAQDSTADMSRLQVLLVEDNEINLAVAGKFLSNWRIPFAIARNGEEAVHKARTNSFDLILMDLQMPVMNGYEASTRIRKLKEYDYSKTPLIAITAAGAAGIDHKIRAAGMTDIVFKPFKPEELLHKIQQYCPSCTKETAASLPLSGLDASGAVDPSQPLDLSEIASLAGNDTRFVQDLLKLYIEQFDLLHTRALAELEEQNAFELRRIFHKMKPAIAMLRHKKMEQLSSEIHHMLRQEDTDFPAVKGHILYFLSEMEALKKQLQHELSNNPVILN